MYKSFIQHNGAFTNIYLCEGVKTLEVYLFCSCQYLHENCGDTITKHIYSFWKGAV